MTRRLLIKFRCLFILFIFSSSCAYAEQLTFNKSKQNTQVAFSYSWSDHKDKVHELEFALPLAQINTQNHKKFIPDLAQRYVYIEMHKAARQIDPKEARVQIQNRGQDIQVKVTSRSNNLLQKWQNTMAQRQTEALDQYLEDNYYSRFQTYMGQEAVKPDHLRYIADNRAALLPVSQAIYNQVPQDSETRIYINLLLSWVQSIPYNELENRLTSNGAGYLPPVSVVANNQGDCDSKAVLMAGLIRSLLPEVKMAMIYLPGHALLGIVLPFRTAEKTIEIDGSNYLLLEPTGPAKIPLGEITSRSASDIAGGMHSYEVIP